MKKLMTLFLLSFCLLSCTSSSTDAINAVQIEDKHINSVDDQPNLLGTPEEVQEQEADDQTAEVEGFQNDNSVDN